MNELWLHVMRLSLVLLISSSFKQAFLTRDVHRFQIRRAVWWRRRGFIRNPSVNPFSNSRRKTAEVLFESCVAFLQSLLFFFKQLPLTGHLIRQTPSPGNRWGFYRLPFLWGLSKFFHFLLNGARGYSLSGVSLKWWLLLILLFRTRVGFMGFPSRPHTCTSL